MLIADLSIIVRGSEIFLSRCLSGFGISASELMMLMYLYGHENPNQEEIARYFMLDKGTVAKTLQKLERKAFIDRSVNESDQREKVIALTEKAYTVKDVCVNLLRLWNDMAYQGVSAEEVRIFEQIGEKISTNIDTNLDKWERLYGKQKG